LNLNSLIPWLLPLGVVSGGLILGFVFEWVVLRYFRAATKKTAWKWDDIISQASRRSISGLVFVGGVWLAALYAPISPDLKSLIYKIAGAVATVIATFLLARIVAGFIELGMNSVGQAFASASLITNSVKLLIIIIGVLFVVNGFVPITPVIGALGIGGLAAALALQDTLSNLFAGFQIIATRKIRPGDYIQLETGQLGRVVDISWRNVTIESHPDQNLVVVPNSKIATTVMTNYNLPHKLLMDFINVGVSYDSDLRRVKDNGT
jgi:small-conductance mechanosensitive channel